MAIDERRAVVVRPVARGVSNEHPSPFFVKEKVVSGQMRVYEHYVTVPASPHRKPLGLEDDSEARTLVRAYLNGDRVGARSDLPGRVVAVAMVLASIFRSSGGDATTRTCPPGESWSVAHGHCH